ncbi:MAG: ribulose-phosphate 3-epimerase [Planctomycetota bacterium]
MLDLADKPTRPLVAPSVLASDFGRMADDAKDALDAGADLIHIDIMDGHFVGNLSMGPDSCKGLRRHLPDAFLDVHLMVDRPDMYLEPFAEAGANHITFHLEVCNPVRSRHQDADALIDRIEALGLTAGMVINPLTEAHGLEPWLERLRMVLVMSVHPGAGGQAFMPEVLSKVRWLSERLRDDQRLEMDGGVGPDTAAACAQAGCDVMVSGSAVFGAADRRAAIAAMHATGSA